MPFWSQLSRGHGVARLEIPPRPVLVPAMRWSFVIGWQWLGWRVPSKGSDLNPSIFLNIFPPRHIQIKHDRQWPEKSPFGDKLKFRAVRGGFRILSFTVSFHTIYIPYNLYTIPFIYHKRKRIFKILRDLFNILVARVLIDLCTSVIPLVFWTVLKTSSYSEKPDFFDVNLGYRGFSGLLDWVPWDKPAWGHQARTHITRERPMVV